MLFASTRRETWGVLTTACTLPGLLAVRNLCARLQRLSLEQGQPALRIKVSNTGQKTRQQPQVRVSFPCTDQGQLTLGCYDGDQLD